MCMKLAFIMSTENVTNRCTKTLISITIRNSVSDVISPRSQYEQQWRKTRLQNIESQALLVVRMAFHYRCCAGVSKYKKVHVVLALKSLFCSPEYSRPCSSLLLWCLGPWINHLPPIFSSTFYKYKLKQKQTVALYASKREECALVMINWIYIFTQWGRVTHLYVSKLTSIAADNGLSPGRRQAIIWNNAGILFIGPLGTNFSEILIETQTFSLKKIRRLRNVGHFVSASMC